MRRRAYSSPEYDRDHDCDPPGFRYPSFEVHLAIVVFRCVGAGGQARVGKLAFCLSFREFHFVSNVRVRAPKVWRSS